MIETPLATKTIVECIPRFVAMETAHGSVMQLRLDVQQVCRLVDHLVTMLDGHHAWPPEPCLRWHTVRCSVCCCGS